MYNGTPRLTEASETRLRKFLDQHTSEDMLRSLELHQIYDRGRTELVARTDTSESDLFAWVEIEARTASRSSPSGYFSVKARKRQRGKPPQCRIELSCLASGDNVLAYMMKRSDVDMKQATQQGALILDFGRLALKREELYVGAESQRLIDLRTAQQEAKVVDNKKGGWDTANTLITMLGNVVTHFKAQKPATAQFGAFKPPAEVKGGATPKQLPSSSETKEPPTEDAPEGLAKTSGLEPWQDDIAVKFRDSLDDTQCAKLGPILGQENLDRLRETTSPSDAGEALLHILQNTEDATLVAAVALLTPSQQSLIFGLKPEG